MEIKTTYIDGLLLVRPAVFKDKRGCFYESWNSRKFNAAIGKEIIFVQDNLSISKVGVIRGLHYQTSPSAQSKLIRVVSGSILDIAVDIHEQNPLAPIIAILTLCLILQKNVVRRFLNSVGYRLQYRGLIRKRHG